MRINIINQQKKEELKNKYIGMKNINTQGYPMTITNYNTSKDIEVTFDDDNHTVVKGIDVGNFKRGSVNNPNHPTVYGFGIVDVNRNYIAREKEYQMWSHMIERCYVSDDMRKQRDSTYKGCNVCEEWKRYSQFYNWIHSQKNYNQWKNGKFSIDKDIIKKGNKLYCPEYCCLVPNYINNIFTKHQIARGDYPIGVEINIYGTFTVRVRDYKTNKYKHYGNFNTPKEAFCFYKKKKEEYIKKVAQEEFDKGNIIKKCYNSMMTYEVEITD